MNPYGIAMKQLAKRGTRPNTVELTPVKREVLSAKEFLIVTRGDPLSVARSRFVPPVPGKSGFGTFEVVYDIPKLKPAVEQ